MSDYLGPNQTRVLDSDNRSFESVVYQKRKPPLSCEVNLEAKLDADRGRDIVRYLVPSGWAITGRISDNVAESLCRVGDVVCSSSYVRNSFKLIGLDLGQDSGRNIAWINGWPVLVQGTNSPDENDLIILPDPPTIGTRVDFVFLEAWRKLVYPADAVYKHGNFLYGGTNPANDLVDPAMGIETSLRIQLQYRIRVASCDLESYPDGFDPYTVFMQGPLPDPISTSTESKFLPVSGDIGLWIAGPGDPTESILTTVDDHTYAIPMFAVRRRNTGAYNPDSRSNGALKTLADYQLGYASDRPDDLYNDWIVAGDILDMRHRVVAGENLKEICEDAFKKLVGNRLPGKMTKTTLGEDSYAIDVVQPDAISDVDKAGSTRIATGDGIRRVFSNATADQPESFSIRTVNQKIVGTPGAIWAISDSVQVTLSPALYPSGTQIISVNQVYSKQTGVFTQYTLSTMPTGTLVLTLTALAPVLGFTYDLTVEYTIRYPEGPYGLTKVPSLFLEARKEDTTASIAMMDQDIRARMAPPVVTTDGTMFSTLSNRGALFSTPYDFGHQMTHHVIGNGSQIVSIPRNLYGYDILGVVSIKVGGVLRASPYITRSATAYTVDVGAPPVTVGDDIELVLYTRDKVFIGNKQGRAILDCYEMIEYTPDETATGGNTQFHIDTGDKAVRSIATYAGDTGAFAYVDGSRNVLITTNFELPYDSTKTYLAIQFPIAPNSGATIEVPVYTHSAIGATEGYTFFYKTTPYQGLLDSSSTGVMEAVGPAITTTSGSGTMTDYTYSQGTAHLHDSTSVDGTGTQWLSNVQPGYFLRVNADSSREYEIQDVYTDTKLFLKDVPDRTSVVGEAYTIQAKDQPYFLSPNILDILPTLNSNNDSSGKNGALTTAIADGYPVLETRIVSRVQDMADVPAGTVWVGLNTASRGRSTIHMTDMAPLGLGNLGLKFEKLTSSTQYKKTYQSYIFNQGDTGRLYLLVVGSETDNTSTSCFFNQSSNNDSVDIFELPGRPIVMQRIS